MIPESIMVDLCETLLTEMVGMSGVILKMEKKLDGMKDDLVAGELKVKRMKKALRVCTLKIEDIKNGIKEG